MDIKQELSILTRSAVDVISIEELEKKLIESQKKNRPLRVKAGFDPTAPDIHLGHTVLIEKLRQFQEFGHEVYFLVGDFTGMIGDPSGRSETRRPLSKEEVLANAETYKKQIFKILDPRKTKIVFNSSWMEKMTATELIKLCSHYTVARMLERDDFQKRFSTGKSISIHEFIYPLIQGYDSVVLNADVEIGGTDQIFNLLVGRELQRDFHQEPQVVITMPLLEGLDGVQKMSKSLNNYIGITESPKEMFGKIMSISDELMFRYYELLSTLDPKEIEKIKEGVKEGRLHPKDIKKKLAIEIISRFHSPSEAIQAAEEFERVFKYKEEPEEIEEIDIYLSQKKIWLPKLLQLVGLTQSSSEAKRIIQQGGVRVNRQRVSSLEMELSTGNTYLLQVGKRRFKRVHLLQK
ncbi:MAG: tyrosine--tRNA ligase [Deltaproteobacteria bacterium]|nr:tyrosine--tRNA ligase [Deltaproteobacteria bacterium]MDL1971729.1 tyrosine--tRNA ligase [Deltaproteobacteria bacterium]